MKKIGTAKAPGVVVILILLFANSYWSVPVTAAGGGTIQVSKVSSSLSLHIKLKSQTLANPESMVAPQVFPGLNSDAADPGVLNYENVFLYFNQPPTIYQINDLQAQGVTVYTDSWIPPVGNHPSGFILADIPIDKMDALSAKDYIVQMDTAEQEAQPQNDLARQAMGVDSIWSGEDTGAGVTVAVLDSGIDTSNPDFPALNSSNSKDYSNYPTLDDTIINTVTGHGTHVTGSLLGREVNSSTYRGVAPGANLVFLKIGNDTTGAASSSAIIYALKAAVDTYHVKIINVSYGSFSEYHDGSDAVCQAVDYATSQGATVFVAAGNDAFNGWHYDGTVDASRTTNEILLTVGSNAYSVLPMELVWDDGLGVHDNLTLQYYDSNHNGLLSTNSVQSESSKSGIECIAYQLNSTVTAGTYYFRVQNSSPNQRFFHIYYLGKVAQVTFSHPDGEFTIDSPAEADSAIAVGAYVTRNSWTNYQGSSYTFNPPETIGQVASYSNCGPRVDWGQQGQSNMEAIEPWKPNIIAPGSAIISVRDPIYAPGNSNYDPAIIDNDGQNLNGSGPANYYVMEGTSMASPEAAGVGTLLLSKNPNLTPAQIRHDLEITATDVGVYGRDSACGWGLVNANAAINANTIMNAYSDVEHRIGCNDFSSYSTQHTAYLHGNPYLPFHKYRVAYYDGSNHLAATDFPISDGPPGGVFAGTGTLSSQHTFVTGIDMPGTWHVIVSEPTFTPPNTYDTSWAYTIVTETFNVQNSAISPGYPQVTTNPPSNVTTTGATLNATLNSRGASSTVSVSFEYGLTNNYGATLTGNPVSLTNPGDFSANVSGLISGQTYHYRAKADGGTGKVSTGEDMTFITSASILTGKIAYTSSPQGNDDIYIMNADGSSPTQLTTNQYGDVDPSFSPEGTKIAYAAEIGGPNMEIFTMNADGSNKMNLTNNPGGEGYPAWSPDGTKIAFTSNRDGNDEIYVMNVDGSNVIRLTNNSAYDIDPAWSPDGAKIAFVSDRDLIGNLSNNVNPLEIYTMNCDGTNVVRLTNNISMDIDPAWSPDGTEIAFTSLRDNTTSGIYTMNSDGGNQTRLITGLFPAWSPDSSKIAFVGNPQDICIMNADGSNPTRITNVSDNYHYLSWSIESGIAPALISDAASNITANGATLNGYLTDKGSAISVALSFDWGTDTNYTGGNIIGVPVTLSAPGSFTANLTGLTTGQTYHYRAKATGDGTSYGSDMKFIAQNPSIFSKIVFSASPGESKATSVFNIQPVVQLQDAAGNVVNNSSAAVTLTISSGTGKTGAVLAGTTTVNAVNGVATFSGLSINLANPVGHLYTLTATSGNFTANSSPLKVVHPGDANGDGEITMGDVTKVEREILTLDSPTCGADPNNDGEITMGDVTKIERIILTLDPTQG